MPIKILWLLFILIIMQKINRIAILSNISNIVKMSPYKCTYCRFKQNTTNRVGKYTDAVLTWP